MRPNNPYKSVLKLKKAHLTPAQEAIKDAFLQLCRTKPFATISVTDLCGKAHVARTTFYASYSNTDSLLQQIEDGLIEDVLKVNVPFRSTKTVEAENSMFSRNVMKFVAAHETELKILLIDQPDYRLIEKWKTAVKFHFWEILNAKSGCHVDEMALEIIASMAVGGYTHLLKHPEEIKMDELAKMLNAALSAVQF